MALSWTMDKIGPIARTVDDCGIVFNQLQGADSGDPTAVDRWFRWPVTTDLSALRIGRVEGVSLAEPDAAVLEILADLGANIVPVTLPSTLPEWAISLMLDAEAATIFHDLVAINDTDGLNRWPSVFRKLHFFSAVDYLHAARLRTKLMQEMAEVFRHVDLYVGGNDLGICNLTGHPTIVLPSVISSDEAHPQPLCGTITGRLHDEATLLAVAEIVEAQLTSVGELRPPI